MVDTFDFLMNKNTAIRRKLNRSRFSSLIGIAIMFLPALGWAQSASTPTITLVANAEGGSATIAPNTWVEIKGSNLAPVGDSRSWQASDFVNSQMPTQLDGVAVTMNGENAYLYYISPTQVNVLTPPDLTAGPAQVKVTTGGVTSAAFTAQAQEYSLSFFIFGAGPYVVGTHANGSDLGPTSLYPGLTTPAAPGEVVILYANGFGPVSPPVVAGSDVQSGSLPVLPVIQVGGIPASVQFAGLVSPGLYQFNVVVPESTPNGDNTLTAQYNGFATQSGVLVTVQNPNAVPQVQNLSLSTLQAISGATIQGTIYLSIPATAAGITVVLSASSQAVSLPSSVTIPAGSAAANFNITAGTVSSTQTVTITAMYAGVSVQAQLTVNPTPTGGAVCYQFSSGSAATLTINITNLPAPSFMSLSGISIYSYVLDGLAGNSATLSLGQSTYSGNPPVELDLTVEYAPTGFSSYTTGFVLSALIDLTTGAAATVDLQGAGNLLPNGVLPAVFPSLSAWESSVPPTIAAAAGNNAGTLYSLTSVASCGGSQ